MADAATTTTTGGPNGAPIHEHDTAALLADVTDEQMEQLQASVLAYTAAHGISSQLGGAPHTFAMPGLTKGESDTHAQERQLNQRSWPIPYPSL